MVTDMSITIHIYEEQEHAHNATLTSIFQV